MQTHIARGKVDVSVTIITLDGGATDVQINQTLAASYLSALREMGSSLGLQDDITTATLCRFSDLYVVRKPAEDIDEVWACVQTVALKALEDFVQMREVEGAKLREDLLGRLVAIEEHLLKVEEQSPRTVESYRNRLYQKMSEVLGQAGIDEQRILAEAAIFAERVSVDEETVRLRSHIAQFRQILDSGEAVGRKLDFLVQEFNREANTIGSKCQDLAVSRLVVEIKSEIEKLREQIQNLE